MKERFDRPQQGNEGVSKEDRDIARFLQRNWAVRHALNFTYRMALYAYMISTPTGRKWLRNPESRRFFFDREAHTGFLEGSILANELFYPNPNEDDQLQFDKAGAGQWVVYDFNRPKEFGESCKKQTAKGRLLSFPLLEVIDNSSDRYTPTKTFNLYDFSHVILMDYPTTISRLLEYGFVEESTYKDAYKKVGLYEEFLGSLEELGLDDRQVYRVTPKGNGLLMVSKEDGQSEKKEDKLKVLRPAFAYPQ